MQLNTILQYFVLVIHHGGEMRDIFAGNVKNLRFGKRPQQQNLLGVLLLSQKATGMEKEGTETKIIRTKRNLSFKKTMYRIK